MPNFYSPEGNFEVWNEKPEGYFTAEEWEEQERPKREEEARLANLARLDAFYSDLNKAKKALVDIINKETENKILQGFYYNYKGETLHFSYDRDDQQNFSDAANLCLSSNLGDNSLPQFIIWNAYLDNNLKRIELNLDDFQALYINGALAHKNSIISNGSEKKTKIYLAKDRQELEIIVKELNLTLI